MNQFLADLRRLRHQGWSVRHGWLRNNDGKGDCPGDAVADYRGIQGYNWQTFGRMGLYRYQNMAIIAAADDAKSSEYYDPELRRQLLEAVGLAP